MLPYPHFKASPELEAEWAQLGLAANTNRDPIELARELTDLLIQMAHQRIDPREAIEHPAAVMLVAQLAELAAINFHYPSDRLWQCLNTAKTALCPDS